MFYDAGSGWSQSTINGSWMIRPVFGSKKGLLTVPEQSETTLSAFTIFPNPSKGNITIKNEMLKIKNAEVHNLMGEIIFNSSTESVSELTIDISTHPAGIYFLRITDEKGNIFSNKIILTK